MVQALIIEDNRQMSDSLKMMLTVMGIEARQAFTPRTGFLALAELLPDVVFLDINLPTVDGFEVLAYIRRDPRFEKVPVVFVTSNDQPETYQKAKEGNAVGVVIKPATFEAIQLVLKKLNLV